jgi:hypothetical protein
MPNKLLNVAQLIAASLKLSATPADIVAHINQAGGVDWSALLDHADGHSLTPLLYDVWRQAGALTHISPPVAWQMARAYADNTRRNGFIRQELLEIQQILTRAKVSALVLKGWPLAERLYPDPACRVLYDHDLLARPGQAGAGQAALVAAGYTPLPLPDGWIDKHLPPLWRNPGYVWDGYLFDPHYPRPVELHTMLWDSGWRGLRVNQMPHLWQHAQTRLVAGTPMQVLSDEDTLVHLTMHFAGHLVEGQTRLNQLLDIALFLQQAPLLDWERIWAQAARAGIRRFVYASLYLARQIFEAPLPPAHIWKRLESVVPAPFRDWLGQTGVNKVLCSDYRRPVKELEYRLTFLAANSWLERLGIFRFALLPPAEQLMVKYKVSRRIMAPFFYPRFWGERALEYRRSWQRANLTQR